MLTRSRFFRALYHVAKEEESAQRLFDGAEINRRALAAGIDVDEGGVVNFALSNAVRTISLSWQHHSPDVTVVLISLEQAWEVYESCADPKNLSAHTVAA
jgi:hypothetical protein